MFFQIYRVSNRQSSRLKVVDNHPCDFFYLTRLFQYLLAPPKHFTVILMFSPIGKDFFFLIAKVRVALGMSPNDRFYPPRQHILENSFHVQHILENSFQVQHKPMTQKYTKARDLTRNPPLTCKCIKLQRDRDLPVH